ncbi:hypothetical protein ACXR2T_15100 [Leucobacter sp. HY1910]
MDWDKSFHDAVIAESAINWIVSNTGVVQSNGLNVRRHRADISGPT